MCAYICIRIHTQIYICTQWMVGDRKSLEEYTRNLLTFVASGERNWVARSQSGREPFHWYFSLHFDFCTMWLYYLKNEFKFFKKLLSQGRDVCIRDLCLSASWGSWLWSIVFFLSSPFLFPFSLLEQSSQGSEWDFRVQGSNPASLSVIDKTLSLRSSTERPAGWAEPVVEEDISEPEPDFPR